MYKLLLCWRYLRTRYIALASIVSVMLGVATMIVVNSVMAGFRHEMQDRIHTIIGDVVFESHSLGGFPDPDWHMQQIRQVLGDDLLAMTPAVNVPAMFSVEVHGQWVTRPVQLIGISPGEQHSASDFSRYLQHPENRERLSFELRHGGYDTRDHQGGDEARPRPQMEDAGWPNRRRMAAIRAARMTPYTRIETSPSPAISAPAARGADPFGGAPWSPEVLASGELPSTVAPVSASNGGEELVEGSITPGASDPFASHQPQGDTFDPAKEQHSGIVLGIALANYRDLEGNEQFLVLPGDDVKLTFPTAGTPPRATDSNFTVVDFYESKMSEYDSTLVFVPLDRLQQLRGMIDPRTGVGLVNSIQLWLRPGCNLDEARNKLRAFFPPELYAVSTWRDKQGPLLAAVQMETAILNVLLFLIIAVAGFGILAIFFMIVVEKTRDIGVLKSLGASGRGIMGIFLGYGLGLGLVGSGVGCVGGLLFVHYINEIADLLGMITGHEVFDPAIYYFYRIPTIIDAWTVGWIVVGALAIAVLASVLPARRAALLHPVEALRYE